MRLGHDACRCRMDVIKVLHCRERMTTLVASYFSLFLLLCGPHLAACLLDYYHDHAHPDTCAHEICCKIRCRYT